MYVYYTAADDNRIARLTYDGTALGEPEVVVTGIDKARIHAGGQVLRLQLNATAHAKALQSGA